MSTSIRNILFLTILKSYVVTSYEYRYVPESAEFDKNIMYKSISNQKNFIQRRSDYNGRFLPKFNLGYNNNIKTNLNKENVVFANDKNSNIKNKSSYDKFSFDDTKINSKFDLSNLSELNRIEVQNNSNSVVSIHSTFINETHAIPKFPIYFTNPTTGIVYAISEVGYNFSIINSIQNVHNNYNNNNFNENLKVPIYIPKEQYDNDIKKLKLKLKNQCNRLIISQKLLTDTNNTKSTFYFQNNDTKSTNNNNTKNPKKTQISNVLTLEEFNKIQNSPAVTHVTPTPLTIPTFQVLTIKPTENKITESSEEDDEDESVASIPNPAEAIGDIFNDVYNTVGNNEESSSEESEETVFNPNIDLIRDKIIVQPVINSNIPNKVYNKLPYNDYPNKDEFIQANDLNVLSENFRPIPLVTTTVSSFINLPNRKIHKHKKHNQTFTINKPLNKYSSTIFSRRNDYLNEVKTNSKGSFTKNVNQKILNNNINLNSINNSNTSNTVNSEIFFEGAEIPENPIYDDNYLNRAGILVLKRNNSLPTYKRNNNKNFYKDKNFPIFQKDYLNKENITFSPFESLDFFDTSSTLPAQIYHKKGDEKYSDNVLIGLSEEMQVTSNIHDRRRKLSKRSLTNNSRSSTTNSTPILNIKEKYNNNLLNISRRGSPDNFDELKSNSSNSKDRKFSKYLGSNFKNEYLTENLNKDKTLTTRIDITNHIKDFAIHSNEKRSNENLKTLSPHFSYQSNKSPPCQNNLVDKDVSNEDDDDDDVYYDFDSLLGQDYDEEYDSNEKENDSDYSDLEPNENTSNENSADDNTEEQNFSVLNKNKLVNRKRKTIEKHKKRKKIKYKSKANIDKDDNDIGMIELLDAFTYPFRFVFKAVFEKIASYAGYKNIIKDKSAYDHSETPNDNRKPKYPSYTFYNSYNENDSSSGTSWFNSWFNYWNDDKLVVVSNQESNSESGGWFDYFFGDYDEKKTTPSTNIEDDYDYTGWFTNWFDNSPNEKTQNFPVTTTTSVPILTIENPMKNPQKWIGILAQHIVDSTSSTSVPIIDENELKEKLYEKYQIWRLKPNGESQLKALERFKKSSDGVEMQWLQGPTLRGLTDVLIPHHLLTNFQGTLNYEEISHEVLIYDLGKAIAYEKTKQNSSSNNPTKKLHLFSNRFLWTKYHNYDEIIRFIENLQVQNSEIVEIFHIGRSYEGRPLIVVKISKKENQLKKKKLKEKKKGRNSAIFIEAGIYGREWITPATATWIINELVKIMKNNETEKQNEIARKSTWYIAPVINPDSYEYSQKYDRMWRKSRSKQIVKPNGIISTAMEWFKDAKSNKICYGVDLDRNWDYDWNQKENSNFPCDEFYNGAVAFSEPETRALSKFIMDHRKQIKIFFSFKAYGQIISYPNKFNTALKSQKFDELLDVAMVGNDGLRKSGSENRYKVDSSNDLLSYVSGSSNSFAMYEASIPFSYTIHLSDNGVHGYLLPGSNIEPTSKDAFQIIKSILDYI